LALSGLGQAKTIAGAKARNGGASRVALVFTREALRRDYNYRVRYMG
jgi:hypothetical protein